MNTLAQSVPPAVEAPWGHQGWLAQQAWVVDIPSVLLPGLCLGCAMGTAFGTPVPCLPPTRVSHSPKAVARAARHNTRTKKTPRAEAVRSYGPRNLACTMCARPGGPQPMGEGQHRWVRGWTARGGPWPRTNHNKRQPIPGVIDAADPAITQSLIRARPPVRFDKLTYKAG